MLQKIKPYLDKASDEFFDTLFNRILTSSTVLAIAGFVIHIWYPQYKEEYDIAVGLILAGYKQK